MLLTYLIILQGNMYQTISSMRYAGPSNNPFEVRHQCNNNNSGINNNEKFGISSGMRQFRLLAIKFDIGSTVEKYQMRKQALKTLFQPQ